MAKQTVNIGSSANDGTGDQLRVAFDKLNDNFDEVYGNNFVTSGMLNSDVVSYDKLDDEFTTSAAISASAVDFSSAAVFTKTLTANTTLTFSNVSTGMVKTLVISGDFTLTFPSGVKTLNGTYSGTATNNVIQLISTNGSTDIFATISNYTA